MPMRRMRLGRTFHRCLLNQSRRACERLGGRVAALAGEFRVVINSIAAENVVVTGAPALIGRNGERNGGIFVRIGERVEFCAVEGSLARKEAADEIRSIDADLKIRNQGGPSDASAEVVS